MPKPAAAAGIEKLQRLDKSDGSSKDILADNIAKLKELFPEVFAEGKIDFDALKQLLGEYVDDANERYSLTWNGKSKARWLAQTRSMGTLRPCPEESVNWDTTENLFIEGDNLEVLKLLQKPYYKKIKMIYIDPPYNTGNDLIYPDNFRNNIKNYLELTGQTDGNGRRLSTNPETSGRFHTDWLNMMYPRLKLARNLLREDGLIFISIDETEQPNLRKLCDEVFGEENFCGVIKRRAARKTAFPSKKMTDICDYVVIYAKSEDAGPLSAGQVSDGTRPVFNRGNAQSLRILRGGAVAKCDDGDYSPGIYAARSVQFELLDPLTIRRGGVLADVRVRGPWRINQDVLDVTLFVTQSLGLRRTMIPAELEQAKLLNDLLDDKACYNERGSEELAELLGGNVFSHPKPSGLVSRLISSAANGEREIMLDFFAGSCTAAHAVLDLNKQDGGNRKFILAQLPEPCAADSEAFKAGYKNIAEIGKERIRRVIKKIQAEQSQNTKQAALPCMDEKRRDLDLEFKVFKLDSSNIKTWDPDFDQFEHTLLTAAEIIKPDRSEADVLYEILLKYGLDLTLPVEKREIGGKVVHIIGGGGLVVCLASGMTLGAVEKIAAIKKEFNPETPPGMRMVFKDAGFANDELKTNAAQILKQHGIEDVRAV